MTKQAELREAIEKLSDFREKVAGRFLGLEDHHHLRTPKTTNAVGWAERCFHDGQLALQRASALARQNKVDAGHRALIRAGAWIVKAHQYQDHAYKLLKQGK